jgi:DNA-binding NtrC family response regulator
VCSRCSSFENDNRFTFRQPTLDISPHRKIIMPRKRLEMAQSFLQKLFGQRKPNPDSHSLHVSPAEYSSAEEPENTRVTQPDLQKKQPAVKINSLFAFVDLKDPFAPGEIAGEELPGPILSLMSVKRFGSLFLFHTPHVRENAVATIQEVARRYPECRVSLHELPVSDAKDYSALMGRVSRLVRDLTRPPYAGDNYVCVSSGTAEMRAIWFLLTGLGILPAKLIQVGSPARPLFGPANVRDLQIDTSDWPTIRDLAMPLEYYGSNAGKGHSQSLHQELSFPGFDVFAFDTAYLIRLRDGDPATEKHFATYFEQLLCLKLSSRTLSPDALESLHQEALARVMAELARDARIRHPERFGAFVNSICNRVLLEHYQSASKLGQMEDSAVDMEGTSREEETAFVETLRMGSSASQISKSSQFPSEPLTVPGLDEALQELGIYVGSAILRHAAEQAGIAAGSHLPILLSGETGTGKERFAQLIHRLSPRFDKPMVAINCAAIPEPLAESYFFGHIKGAFSDAHNDQKGMFESADRGTLFLDEIAELTLEVQAKLLRVIQDGAVQRLGSTVPHQVDVRIIAASNRDLRKELSAGRFREDLFFRLEVVQIKIPALRDRRSEIPELALLLLRQINQRRHKPRQLTPEALLRLERYDWPGNVRQLSNVLERSVLYARGDALQADDLLITNDEPPKDMFSTLPEPCPGFSVEDYLGQARKQLFLRALAACKGNQAEAAEMLGVSKQAVNKFVAGQSGNVG